MRRRVALAIAAILSGSLGLAATPPQAAAPAASSVTPTAPKAQKPANGKPAIETGPALGWVFPIFTDKEGYHLLTLRGSAARVVGQDKIEVTGFSAFVFSGDATERVDTVLLSPKATFYPKQNRAAGDSTVRLIHDDVEVTGADWQYDHATKYVSLARDVRVTFRAQINDILK